MHLYNSVEKNGFPQQNPIDFLFEVLSTSSSGREKFIWTDLLNMYTSRRFIDHNATVLQHPSRLCLIYPHPTQLYCLILDLFWH